MICSLEFCQEGFWVFVHLFVCFFFFLKKKWNGPWNGRFEGNADITVDMGMGSPQPQDDGIAGSVDSRVDIGLVLPGLSWTAEW